VKKTYTPKKKYSQITITGLTIILTLTFLFSCIAKAESSWTTTTLYTIKTPNQVYLKSYQKIIDNKLHVFSLYKNLSYFSTDVVYLYTNNSEWHTETMSLYNTSLGSGYKTAIDMDSVNNPHMCYYDQLDGNLYYALWNGSQWFMARIADFKGTKNNFGQHCAMIIDNKHNPHIFFYDQNNPLGLIYATTDENFINWSISAIDTGSGVGLEPSVTIDHNNKILISYFDHYHNDHSLRYAYFGKQGIWIFHTIDSEGDVGHESSITVDKNNNPYISYFDKTNENLKYAYSDGNNWSNYTIDSEGNVGSQSTIQIDSNNNPHIVYLNKTNQNTIKYAYKDGPEWKYITISNGTNPLLSLDEEDTPHIVFELNGDIKYTRPDIWISSPATNTTFKTNQASTVIWSSRQDISEVKIELLEKNNKNTVVESKIINNTGLYTWLLSDSLQSGDYQLKISSSSNGNMYAIKNIHIENKSAPLANMSIIALIVVIIVLSIVLLLWFVLRRKK
jgi:hypothetical protein